MHARIVHINTSEEMLRSFFLQGKQSTRHACISLCKHVENLHYDNAEKEPTSCSYNTSICHPPMKMSVKKSRLPLSILDTPAYIRRQTHSFFPSLLYFYAFVFAFFTSKCSTAFTIRNTKNSGGGKRTPKTPKTPSFWRSSKEEERMKTITSLSLFSFFISFLSELLH